MAPDPRALLVMCRRSTGTAGLSPVGVVIPVTLLSPAGHHHCPNHWERTVAVQYTALVLLTTAGIALVPVIIGLLPLSTPVVTAVPLPDVVGPGTVLLSPVILQWPAYLGDFTGTRPCHPYAFLPCTRQGDHPGAVVHPPAPGRCPFIAAATSPHLGHPHLDPVRDKVHACAVICRESKETLCWLIMSSDLISLCGSLSRYKSDKHSIGTVR